MHIVVQKVDYNSTEKCFLDIEVAIAPEELEMIVSKMEGEFRAPMYEDETKGICARG